MLLTLWRCLGMFQGFITPPVIGIVSKHSRPEPRIKRGKRSKQGRRNRRR